MLIKHITFLFFLSSCALFTPRPSLKDQELEKLLNSVKLTGEGKGRLTFGQRQYVFGVDSVLKENHDWILAVAIPLQGEEVMIFPDLKQTRVQNEETESFEERIEKDFRQLKLNKIVKSKVFMKELRSLVRFSLSRNWGQKPVCVARQEAYECELDGEKFLVEVSEKDLTVKKSLGEGTSLQLVGKNLTDSFFAQTDIRLFSNERDAKKKISPFSLELFW